MQSVKPWDVTDVDAVVRLLNAASPFDQFHLENVEEAVFGDPHYASDLLLCARIPEIVGAVAAVARPPQAGSTTASPVGYIKLLAVAPAWQRRGIGTRLLQEAERRLAQGGCATARVFGDAPAYLRPGVDFRLTPLVCFLLQHGYSRQGEAANMEVDLCTADLDTTHDEEVLHGLGIDVRRLDDGNSEATLQCVLDEWGWNWHAEVTRSLRRHPISTHVALQKDQPVAFASHSVSGPGQFGPTGTLPQLRGRGIGRVLLKRCLSDLRDQGYATADIQWVGPIGFYARAVGARLSRCFWRFERPLEQAGSGLP